MAKAVFIEWTEDVSVGNPVLDAQHQQVFRILNDLWALRNQGGDIRSLLKRLVFFTETHFQYEESFMDFVEFPFLKEHRKYHLAMAKKTKEFESNFAIGKLDLDELLLFLKEWWLKHILDSDRDYLPYAKHKDL